MNTKHQRHAALNALRAQYGRSSQVTYAHLEHRLDEQSVDTCPFCRSEGSKSAAQRERQMTRKGGKYAEYGVCEDCGKKLPEHATHVVPEDGIDAGNGVISVCAPCAKKYEGEKIQ